MKVKHISQFCFTALVFFILIKLWGRLVTTPEHLPIPPKMGDYRMFANWAAKACEEKNYPPSFVYPPATLLFWAGLHSFGFAAGAILWLALLSTCMVGCLWFVMNLTRDGPDPFGGVIVALAFVAVEYYMVWDLKSLNCNSIYFLFVLMGAWFCLKQKPVPGGILLAASVTFKLYTVALIPWLVLRREWRTLGALFIGLVIFFVGVPILCLGWQGALEMTQHWLEAVRNASRPDYPYVAYKVSPSWIALVLLNPDATAGKHNVFNWNIASIVTLVRVFMVMWSLTVVAYFLHTLRLNRHLPAPRQRTAFLLDLSVCLIWLLPCSSTLQPHHVIVLLLPAVVLLRIAFRPDQDMALRYIAGLTVAFGFCLTELGPSHPLRGIGVMFTLMVYLAGIWATRCKLSIKAPIVAVDHKTNIPVVEFSD